MELKSLLSSNLGLMKSQIEKENEGTQSNNQASSQTFFWMIKINQLHQLPQNKRGKINNRLNNL